MRFFLLAPDGDFAVELGVTTTTLVDVADDPTVRLGELPAGRYAVFYLHEGAYSADDDRWAGRDLAAAHGRRPGAARTRRRPDDRRSPPARRC
jgi:hypothetical protein